jgi:glycosyltransferase involved in cell wall biosynthesis
MNWSTQCAVVIPCRNEVDTIARVLSQLPAWLPTRIVVDDGSTDDTAQAAVAAGARVLAHGRCAGKGAALRTGWEHCRRQNFRWALCMDGDGQHAPEDIPQFFRHAEAGSAALIIGNRFHAAWKIPWLRRQVNRWMSRRLSRRFGQDLPDTQCGFRLLQLAALDQVLLRTNHFEIESEMVARFLQAGLEIAFVPVRPIYACEQSKICPVTDTWRWFRWWCGVRDNSPSRV